ncbi:hypothetical protein JDW21_19425 [Bacillus subtilis]|uniref:Uncharacterized protein n=1 Tax=Bacillus phage FADO TaxID=2917160 RepID=A0AAE9G8Z6_9CAUD|nr:hypothetical protein P9294_gp199 [Bacillus phage FADO]UNY48914.1 hypothetical protein fado_199 [Bacillus phage FADO]
MKHKFELIDGRIYLITKIDIWGGAVEKTDVTDEVMPVVDNYLDHLLKDYKRVNGIVTYVGKDKDRYKK